MFNLFDKTHLKCCFCVLHSLTFKALCVFVSQALVCVFVHIWAIMCAQDHVMYIWHLYSVFSSMDRLIEAVRNVCLIKSMIKAIYLGSWASTPQPLSQSYDSHCGQQAIAKSAAIRCTSVDSYICLFLDMCVRVKWTCLSCSHQISCSYYAVRVLCAFQAWDVVANMISRYNTRKYIKKIALLNNLI